MTLTLRQHLDQYAGKDPLRLTVASAVDALAKACIEIADLIGRGVWPASPDRHKDEILTAIFRRIWTSGLTNSYAKPSNPSPLRPWRQKKLKHRRSVTWRRP